MDQYKSLKYKALMIKSRKSSQWQSLHSFGDEGVTSSRHPSVEVMAESLVRMESGRCFPEVRKTIQSRQFLKHLERGLKLRNPKVYKTKW